MTDLLCLGCIKRFPTTKALSAHEGRCKESKSVSTDLFSKHHRVSSARRKKQKRRRSPSSSPSHSSSSPSESTNRVASVTGQYHDGTELEMVDINKEQEGEMNIFDSECSAHQVRYCCFEMIQEL